MALKHVRLELARTPDHPEGSIRCGYELNLPLDADGKFDAVAWKSHKKDCTVRRFWEGEADEIGEIVKAGRSWAFSYDPTTETDDEPMFRLEDHKFKQGEYVSITEHDGVQRTFRVVYVR
jgi:hypothetical protein